MLKATLRTLFDDNCPHTGWQRWVRCFIVALIVLCGALSFTETMGTLPPATRTLLLWADRFIVVAFTIEVSLRIWVGGWRYVLSFYGLIDLISTYPFYLGLFTRVPYALLRVLRVLRLLRIFRFLPGTSVLIRAFKARRHELAVSVQFLVIFTFVLSIMLYHVEHAAQPDVYDDGITSVVWAFAQYIGDPGSFADNTPVTVWGKVIAFVIGVLGIAIFAVPAGIIGSSFIEVIEQDDKERADRANIAKVKSAFMRKQDRDTYMQICPEYEDLMTIQAEKSLDESEVIDAVQAADSLRLRNPATTLPRGERMRIPSLTIEHFPHNCAYGNYIDRGSNVTIVATSCPTEAGLGWFSWYLALFGGFNYVSKEYETDPLVPKSYYLLRDTPDYIDPTLRRFKDDLEGIARRAAEERRGRQPGSDKALKPYTIFVLSADGGMESPRPTQIHFTYGAQKGDETYDDREHLTISDIETFQAMYADLCKRLEPYGLTCDRHRYHKSNARHLPNLMEPVSERFTMRVAWDVTLRHANRVAILWQMAEALHRHFAPTEPEHTFAEFKVKDIGYECEPDD